MADNKLEAPRQRWILHVDMDAFYASVEQRDHPEYRGKPVIVGGVGHRGVVSTASYEARKFGVHSALPMETARRRCPQGIFIPGDHGKYARVSRQIMSILNEFSPLVEPLSLDEAFLDITGMELLYASPVDIAREIKRRVRVDLDLTVSAGVAPNKFLAKMASDLQKPDGLVVVEPGSELDFLRDLPIEKLWGVGEVTAKSLRAQGLLTIGQLAQLDERGLRNFFGNSAGMVYGLVRGRDERPVEPDRDAKSIGAEETLAQDLLEVDDIRTVLMDLADRIGVRLRQEKLAARTVMLKLRYGNFQTLTRQRKLDSPTQTEGMIYRTAMELLEQHRDGSLGVRLLGLTVSHFEPEGRAETSLFDDPEEKGRQLSATMDRMRAKFGPEALMHGRLAPNKKTEGKADSAPAGSSKERRE